MSGALRAATVIGCFQISCTFCTSWVTRFGWSQPPPTHSVAPASSRSALPGGGCLAAAGGHVADRVVGVRRLLVLGRGTGARGDLTGQPAEVGGVAVEVGLAGGVRRGGEGGGLDLAPAGPSWPTARGGFEVLAGGRQGRTSRGRGPNDSGAAVISAGPAVPGVAAR